MPRTMYKSCQDIMSEARSLGFLEQITWADLLPIVRKHAGSSDLTIKRYRRELQVSGFLKSINQFTFEVVDKEIRSNGAH